MFCLPRFRLFTFCLLVVTLLLLVPESGFSQSVLNFPRVISNSSVFTGLAICNPTSRAAVVKVTAFQADGVSVSGDGIKNPVEITIPSGGQVARQFVEIFGGTGDFDGWVQATSTVSGLTGFFLSGNSGQTDLDGAASIAPAASFVLPFANEDSEATTEVTIVDVGAEPAHVTLTLYDLNGASMVTTHMTLAGLGLIRQTLTALFGASDYANVSHLVVTSDRPLLGHEIVTNYRIAGTTQRHESVALSGQLPTSATNYVLPQFTTGSGRLSLVGLVNMGKVAQQVTLTAYNNDGKLADAPNNPKLVSLNANGGLRDTVEHLFGFTDERQSTGWIKVSSSPGNLSCYVVHGSNTTAAFAAVSGIAIQSAAKTEVFSRVALTGGFYTGLALVNPGTTVANVKLYTMRSDGTTAGEGTFKLEPNRRIGQLLGDLLPASSDQSAGWALIRSDQPLIGDKDLVSTNF